MQVLSALASPLLAVGEAIFGGKSRAPIKPLPPVTRNDAAKIANDQQDLARRKGAAADILTGTTGAEAAAGTTGRLVAGS